MNIHICSLRRRLLGGALAAAVLSATPLTAALASVGGWQEDPNIYSPDFWNQSAAAPGNCFDRSGYPMQCPTSLRQQAGGSSGQSQSEGMEGGVSQGGA